MPTFISGLPVHVLLVHAVVVLVPMAILSTATIALWPSARRRYGALFVGLTALATLSIPLATSSGERLRAQLPPDALIAAHAHLGDQLLPFVGLLLLTVTAMVVMDHYRRRAAIADSRPDGPGAMLTDRPGTRPAWTRPLTVVLAALTLLMGAATALQVVRIGDSGARAAWSRVHYLPPRQAADPADARHPDALTADTADVPASAANAGNAGAGHGQPDRVPR